MTKPSVTPQAPRLTLSGPVATIEFSRPEMANRLSPDDLDALNRHIAAVNERTYTLVHPSDQSNDLREGALAFIEKRTPKLNGQ